MPPKKRSLFDYFGKAPPPSQDALQSAQPTRQTKSEGSQAVPPTVHTGTAPSNLAVSKTTEPLEYTSSSLSRHSTPGPEADRSSSSREPTPLPVVSSNEASNRIIYSTDDEDSDCSLEDMEIILATTRTAVRPLEPLMVEPKTPNAPRFKPTINFHTSPLTVLSKSQFDMKSLMSHALKDDAAEASSKRVKVMMAQMAEKEHSFLASQNEDANKAKLGALLESVAGDQEGGVAKVTRAIMRTEATIPEKRWYFFDTQPKPMKVVVHPFPKNSALKEWERELKDPQMRQQSFVSGFVEDMVRLGKQLPDELFLWVLDEAFLELRDPLRKAYLNVLQECPLQAERLIQPKVIQSLFRKLGATDSASTTTETIQPVLMIPNPYPGDWTRICSTINFLSKMGTFLNSDSRKYLICMILRMSVDRVVIENVDLIVAVHQAMYYLCRDTPEPEWESTCSNICKTLMTTIPQPSFRLQTINSIPSGTAKTHDLRRRLAMCFFFDDISYSTSHPHTTMDLRLFINRLEDSRFDARPNTEYPELTALVLLLDVAVDDGQSDKLDLTDLDVEKRFNKDVDSLVASIKDIMTSIGNPGAAFISRIEAKEALELVSQRIADTVRTKKVVKESWFDMNRNQQEDMESEKQGMSNFLARRKKVEEEVNGSAAT